MTLECGALRVKVAALGRKRQLLITDGAGNQALTFCRLAGLDLPGASTLINVPK